MAFLRNVVFVLSVLFFLFIFSTNSFADDPVFEITQDQRVNINTRNY
jgi:hypothetical protein